MHIMDLETRLDNVVSENKMLQDAKARAEQAMLQATHERDGHVNTIRQATEAVASRDMSIQEKDAQIAELRASLIQLQREVERLTELNNQLSAQHEDLSYQANQRHISLESENTMAHAQWQTTSRELQELKEKHQTLNDGMEQIVADEIANATVDKDAEIQRLSEELMNAMEQIKTLQGQIMDSKQGETFLTVRDEDYFDSACQQLCQHVQQWVLRFSKFSDNRMCKLSSDINDDKIRDRLDDAVLDGSDVDVLLSDRVRRRDIFMSLVMSMIWEYVFTRYLFGMDREQRSKLKILEKTLLESGKYFHVTICSTYTNVRRSPTRCCSMASHYSYTSRQAQGFHGTTQTRHRSSCARDLRHSFKYPATAIATHQSGSGFSPKSHWTGRRSCNRHALSARRIHHATTPTTRV